MHVVLFSTKQRESPKKKESKREGCSPFPLHPKVLLHIIWVVIVSSCVFFLATLACLLKEASGDSFLINCGSPNNITVGGRVYIGEKYALRYLVTPIDILTETSINSNLPLHKTARIFNGSTTYNFPIKQMGRYFIRFHFFPITYKAYNLSSAIFDVTAYQFMLMNNFTPPISGTTKEYSINVTSHVLVISFVPSSNSVAFLNALEVFPVPDALIKDNATMINPTHAFIIPQNLALETVARVNMGDSTVDSTNDALWRTWEHDDSFLETKGSSVTVRNLGVVHYRSGLSTREFAPIPVYGTCRRLSSPNNVNISWKFNVDVGFQYFIRVHICDIVSSSKNKINFNLFINSWLVFRHLNLTSLEHGFWAAPVYIDFVTPIITGDEISVSIGSVLVDGNRYHAFLNGLEIMKISHYGSLSTMVILPSSQQQRSNKHISISVLAIVSVASLLLLAILVLMLYQRRSRGPGEGHLETTIPYTTSLVDSDVAIHFSLASIKVLTNNFDESRVIGTGGFGKVYKGLFRDGQMVAVKRNSNQSRQGTNEFRTEIELLSRFRHRHLVRLIGYCDENSEIILVYEYMQNGTLKDHLYRSPPLSWEERLKVCIGTASALHYLHMGFKFSVIHRDVKPSNILLDQSFNAKVSDFGLSKAGVQHDQDPSTTLIKGTPGYIDPEYSMSFKVTQKSDVYSFGLVLLEVLCTKRVVDETREIVHLGEWAKQLMQNGQLETIIDPTLQGQIKPNALKLFQKTAAMCIASEGSKRPSMSLVMADLMRVDSIQKGENFADPEEATTSRQHEDNLSDSMGRAFFEMVEAGRQLET